MKLKFPLSKEDLEKEYKLNSVKKIAEKHKLSENTVLYWLKKHKIPIKKNTGGHNLIDLIGQKFGDLTVLYRVVNNKSTAAKWLCSCECGKTKEVVRCSLVRGLTTSCGCKKFNRLYKGYQQLSGCYWKRVKEGAKDRNLEISITIQDAWNQFIKQSKKCALTGLDINLVTDLTTNRKNNTASLDRIDNSLGYTKNNIQWVHKQINMMRRKLSIEEFIYFCKKVSEHKGK